MLNVESRRCRCQGGFTLIEMLIVMSILAVLMALALIGITAMRGQANRDACKADVDTYQAMVEAYRVNSWGQVVPTLSDLQDGSTPLIKRRSRFVGTMSINAVTGEVSNTMCP